MKILIFNWQDRLHPQSGGAEVHLHEIFGRIARKGHSVTLVCCGFPGAPRTEVLDNINIIRVGSRSTFNYTVPFWWMHNGKRFAPDIVIDDVNKIPFYTPLYVKRPVLAILHHFFGKSIFQEVGKLSGTYVHLFEERIASVYRNTPICTVSESTRAECIERGLPEKNVSIIYNALEQGQFPMKVMEKATVPTIAFFGRLKKYKSIDHIIKALVQVRKHFPTARLEVMGTGDQRESLEHLAQDLGLGDGMVFHGYVADEQKAELLSRAHVVVNSSIKEGWGITNLEANACGTPVVSADVPGLRDSVMNGVSGILYPYGDVDALAKTVVTILSDDEFRIKLSTNAIEWAARFTWDNSAEEMLKLCESVVHDWQR